METVWWWEPARGDELVPDYPPVDVTGRVAAAPVEGCDRMCIYTPAGPCDEMCALQMFDGAS